MARTIELTASDGHRLSAYVAEPAGKARGAIIVIQEIFGVTRHIRAVADQYAAAGFAAIAPALFDRIERNIDVPYTDSARGIGYMQKLKNDAVMLDLQAAMDQVAAAGKVGVVGYCWGGTMAYLAAARLKIAAAVAYYGGGINNHLAEKPQCPVMLHFGEQDSHIPLSAVEQIKAQVPGGQVFLYPAGHGFNCSDRGSFNADCAKLAFDRSLEFLNRHLGAQALQLKDAALLREQCFVDGHWVDALGGGTLDVHNPATSAKLGTVPNMGAAETRRAIASAAAALPPWAAKTAKERAVILRRWFDLMMLNQQDLATLMTAEQGKPMAEAMGEIFYAASFVEWFAEEAKRLYGDVIPGHQADKRILVLRQPVGVVAAITPWNFPAAMITRKAGPALAAGCTMVLKPATQTPYSALALAELAARAGVPAGVFNVVTGSAAAIGGEMTSNSAVRKLTFTGSTEIGKKLMAQCSGTMKKLSLELGGNAPFLVFDDADLDAAVQGALASKYRNTGQTCVCANRFLVQASVYDAFAGKLREAVAKLRVGDGLAGVTDQGPLIDSKAVEKVEEHIADAVTKGAKIAVGGKRHALGGTFFEPTILVDVTPAMLVAREETFGPVAPLFKFDTEAEAIAMANDTEFGLAAYVYTRDLARSWRVSEAIEYGIVGLNTGLISTEVAPFGGVKESGTGREGSKYGILDYTEMKYVCVGGVS